MLKESAHIFSKTNLEYFPNSYFHAITILGLISYILCWPWCIASPHFISLHHLHQSSLGCNSSCHPLCLCAFTPGDCQAPLFLMDIPAFRMLFNALQFQAHLYNLYSTPLDLYFWITSNEKHLKEQPHCCNSCQHTTKSPHLPSQNSIFKIIIPGLHNSQKLWLNTSH